MPDSTILNLPPAGPITGAENMPLVQGSTNVRATQAVLTAGLITSDDITTVVALTQAEYNALTPDEGTLYVITDSGASRSVMKTSATARSNTTVVSADPVLQFVLPAGNWIVTGMLFMDGTAVADAKVCWSGPSDATGAINFTGQGTGASSSTGSWGQTASGRDSTVARGLNGIGTTFAIPLSGAVTIVTAGVFSIQWALNATDGANATSMLPFSWIRAVQV